jgi:hypothetical protein
MSQLVDLTYTSVGHEQERDRLKSTEGNRRRFFHWFLSVQVLLDRFSGVVFAGLLVFLMMWAVAASHAKLLWFDELLGLSIANLPTLGDMISALKAQIDYSAPLYHFLDHYTIRALGYSATSARLPAFAGVFSLLIALYLFVSRRLSPIYGLLAAMLVLCTPARTYAWEGRPYGLVLGLAGIALLMYQRITDERRGVAALIIYSCCCGGLIATHYMSILVIGAFLSGELVRYCENRKFDWPLLIGTVVPPAAVLFMLRNVIRAQIVHRARPSLLAFTAGYDRFRFDTWAFCIAIGFVALAVWLQGGEGKKAAATETPGLRNHELAVAGTLLLLPIVGAVFGRYLTHAYIARYFLCEVVGLSILICYALAAASKRCATIALAVVLAAGVLLLEQGTTAILYHQPGTAIGAEWQDKNDAILFESPSDFLQAYEYYPSRREQFWFAAEPEKALRFKRFDLDDRNMVSLALREPMQVMTLQNVIRQIPNFILFPSSDPNVGWVTNCLLNVGTDLKIAKIMEGPSYLFRVNVPVESVASIGACPASR